MFLLRAYSFTLVLNSLWSNTSPQYSSTNVFLGKEIFVKTLANMANSCDEMSFFIDVKKKMNKVQN